MLLAPHTLARSRCDETNARPSSMLGRCREARTEDVVPSLSRARWKVWATLSSVVSSYLDLPDRGIRTRRGETLDGPGPRKNFSDEEEERDDAGLRWTVASVVGCIPPLAWLSWLLPVISVGAWDADTRRGTIQKNDAYALAAAYFVAYAAHGFNPADGFTWLVTLLCAAHVQLEKTNALMIGPDGDGVAQTQGDDVLTNLYKSIDDLTKTTTVTAEDLKTPRNSVEAAAKIGRAIGKAGVAAKQLGESISDGKLQAEIERAELDAEETVQRQSKELEDWDKRFTSKNDDSV